MGGFQSKTTVKTQLLATGDLLLVSLPKSTSFGHAPPDLVRGLMAAQRGTLATDEEKVFCSTWTHVFVSNHNRCILSEQSVTLRLLGTE